MDLERDAPQRGAPPVEDLERDAPEVVFPRHEGELADQRQPPTPRTERAERRERPERPVDPERADSRESPGRRARRKREVERRREEPTAEGARDGDARLGAEAEGVGRDDVRDEAGPLADGGAYSPAAPSPRTVTVSVGRPVAVATRVSPGWTGPTPSGVPV